MEGKPLFVKTIVLLATLSLSATGQALVSDIFDHREEVVVPGQKPSLPSHCGFPNVCVVTDGRPTATIMPDPWDVEFQDMMFGILWSQDNLNDIHAPSGDEEEQEEEKEYDSPEQCVADQQRTRSTCELAHKENHTVQLSYCIGPALAGIGEELCIANADSRLNAALGRCESAYDHEVARLCYDL